MAIQFKRNSRYPSVTRPGVFARIQELNLAGEDILEDTWFQLTGIDEEEMNKFKFALGTWTQISRRNRKIKILSSDQVNNVTFPITELEEESTTEPKPDYLPAFYVDDPYEWAENIEEPNKDEGMFQDFGYHGGGKLWSFTDWLSDFNADYDELYEDDDGGEPTAGVRERRLEGFGITNSPSWYDRTEIGARSPENAWIVCKRYRKDNIGTGDYIIKVRPYVEAEKYAYATGSLATGYGQFSAGFQWSWRPHGHEITDPTTGLTAFGDWIESNFGIVKTENQPNSKNRYVGIVTNLPKQSIEEIEQSNLFLYHEVGSNDYKGVSAPLEVYFSLNYLEIDTRVTRATDVIKYKVIEWGDEDEQMSDQEILDSEFFYIYESDDTVFDIFKYKSLCLLAEDAVTISGYTVNDQGAERGTLYNHTYIEPGVKTIKTIVFRFDSYGEFLYETSIVHTNIFISDPNQTIQDFNIFGANEFTVLPLEDEVEPIIGSIDKRSEYVKSIEKIHNNDLYEGSDYLEKLYADDFLPKANQDMYGEYAGNIDLGVTRVFKKPYDIFNFIGGDKLLIINNNFQYPLDGLPMNSSATELLIGDEDCVVELNPTNQDNDQIENTGRSNEKGLVMGDFRLVKNPNQKIRKENSMSLPKINTQKKRQAF